MIVEGRVQTSDNAGSEGSIQAVRFGKSGEAFVADAHGRYYDASRRGNVFAYNQTTIGALSVASTSATGLICYNPAVSPKAVALLDIVISPATLPGGQFGFAIFGGIQGIIPTTQTLTGVAIKNTAFGKFSDGASAIQVSSISTVLVATLIRNISGGGAATEASEITPVFIRDDLAGEVMFYPGTQWSVQAITTAVSTLMTYVGEEVPAT